MAIKTQKFWRELRTWSPLKRAGAHRARLASILMLLICAVCLVGVVAPHASLADEQTVTAFAPDDWTDTDPDGNGLNVNKYVESLDDGSYRVTLEQWLNGEESKEALDIVMVLDMSGSMSNNFYDSVYAGDLDTAEIYYVKSGSYYWPVAYCPYCREWHIFDSNYYTNAAQEHRYYINYYGTSSYSKSYYHEGAVAVPCEDGYDTDNAQFYKLYANKLNNLKAAAKDFASVIAQAAEEDGVDHHISLVKFADDKNYAVGNDSCTFPASTGSGTAEGNCTQVVFPMSSAYDSLTSINSAIDSLYALGSTRTDYALEMAQYVLEGQGCENKQVVVLFTDGEPQYELGDLTVSWDETDVAVANSAIATAKELNDEGVEIFTIGLLQDLDDSVPASTSTPVTVPQKNTRFLNCLSSNYPYAQDMDTLGAFEGSTYANRHFYKVVDSSDLSAVFDTIAHRVVQTAAMPLSSATLMQDTVTQYFDVVSGSVQCYTQAYNGTSFSGAYTPVTLVVSQSVGQDGSTTIDVSGFSFQDEYIMPTRKPSGGYGKKLIITFRIKPKDAFIGGNSVPTNGEDSGVFGVQQTADLYPQPTVNVPLVDLAVTVPDKNVYVLDSLSGAQVCAGTEVSYAGRYSGTAYPVTFDERGKSTFNWEDDYAQITLHLEDDQGQTLGEGGLARITADTAAQAVAQASSLFEAAQASRGALLAPNRNPGAAASAKQARGVAGIHVFYPQLTFKDALVDFGQDLPDDAFYDAKDYEAEKTCWANAQGVSSEAAAMVTQQPALSLDYTPRGSMTGKILTLSDIPVGVQVYRSEGEITSYVTVLSHHDCNTADAPEWEWCTWESTYAPTASEAGGAATAQNGTAFLLHVRASVLLPSAGGIGWGFPLIGGGVLVAAGCFLAAIKLHRRGKGAA